MSRVGFSAVDRGTEIQVISHSNSSLEILVSAGQPVRVINDFFTNTRYILKFRPFLGVGLNDADKSCEIHGVSASFLKKTKLSLVDCHVGNGITQVELHFDEAITNVEKVHSFDFRSFNISVKLKVQKAKKKPKIKKIEKNPVVRIAKKVEPSLVKPLPGNSASLLIAKEEVKNENTKRSKTAKVQPIKEEPQSRIEPERLNNAKQLLLKHLYPDAIRYLQALVESGDKEVAREALELLGLAREKNGQISHAKAEYERYLNLYPSKNESRRRVQQRLAGLLTATTPLPKPVRLESTDKPTWRHFGALSQNYRRNEIDSDFIDSEDEVARDELVTRIDYTGRGKSDKSDSRIVVSLSRTDDFIDSQEDDYRIGKLYYKFADKESGSEYQLGRMRNSESGYLGRFDGFSWRLSDAGSWNPGVVVGAPVNNSSEDLFPSDRNFVGGSANVPNLLENVEISTFLFHQNIGSRVDRQFVGFSTQYFQPEMNVYSYASYDIAFGELDVVYLTGTRQLTPVDSLYLSLDYRKSPGLSLSNALINSGYDSLGDLGLSDSELLDLAKDNTNQTSLVTIGGSHRIDDSNEVSADLTVSDVEMEDQDSATEYYANARYVTRNVYIQNDVWIYTTQFRQLANSDMFAFSVNPRFRWDDFRVAPRFFVSRREADVSSRTTYRPSVRIDYSFSDSIKFDAELSINVFEEEQQSGDYTITDTYFSMGYYYVF